MSEQAEQPIKTFTYSRTDLINQIEPWQNGVKLSIFDYLLHETWDNKMRQPNNGPFLYPLDSIIKLMPPGNIKYQGVFCPSRVHAKRPPSKQASSTEKKDDSENQPKVLVPFNSESFHFGKIPKNELLFKVQHVKIGVTSDIFINNAPYERCHSLLITELENQKPQIIFYEGLVAALEVCLLSTHPGMRLLYNSMGACASVNQMHFQIYYTSTYQLPIDHCEVIGKVENEKAVGLNSSAHVFKAGTGLDQSIPCYIIKGINSTNLTTIATQIQTFTDFLVAENIPHNLAISRDHKIGELKVFIWARKFQQNRSYTEFNVACTELIGHLYYGKRELFDSHTETEIAEEFAKMKLDDKVQEKVEKHLGEIFDPQGRGIFSAIFGWF